MRVLHIFILYIYIFSPHFYFLGGKGVIKLLYPLLLMIFFSQDVRTLIYKNKKLIFAFLLIILFAVFRTSFNGDYNYISSSLVALIEIAILPAILIVLINKKEDKFLSKLIFTGVIASIISTLTLLLPGVRVWIINNTVSSDYLQSVFHRGFGLGESLTYSYSISLAIILMIGLYNIKEYKWVVFFIPAFFIGIMLNARIGGVIVIVGLLIYFISQNITKSLRIIVPLIIIVIIGFKISSFYEIINESQKDFVLQFWLELKDFILNTNDAKHSTSSALFGRMWVLPETISEWIVGKGKHIYTEYQNSSDVGFILQLNYGGIIYLILLLNLLVSLFGHFNRKKHSRILVFFIITVIISNSKGEFIINSSGFRVLSILALYLSSITTNRYKTDKWIKKLNI